MCSSFPRVAITNNHKPCDLISRFILSQFWKILSLKSRRWQEHAPSQDSRKNPSLPFTKEVVLPVANFLKLWNLGL